MRLWIAKVRISVALDAGKRPSARLRRQVSSSEELRSFEQELAALDRALRQTTPEPKAPASLHCSIMQAVAQAANDHATAPREPGVPHWAPVPVLALVLVLAAWWLLRSPVRQPAQDAQSLAAVTTALDMGGQMAQRAPSAMVAPLSDELERLNRDLDNTAQFLLASVP
jgi:hypothetical protein